MRAWSESEDENALRFLLYALDHKYSAAGLRSTGLKSQDAFVNKALAIAGGKAGLALELEDVSLEGRLPTIPFFKTQNTHVFHQSGPWGRGKHGFRHPPLPIPFCKKPG